MSLVCSSLAIAIDRFDDLYVADYSDSPIYGSRVLVAIRKITPAGVVTTLASIAGTFTGIAVDLAGNVYVVVYVADYTNSTVCKITPAGVVTTFATIPFVAHGIACDSAGNLYVSAHDGPGRMAKVTSAGVVSSFGAFPSNIWGFYQVGMDSLGSPGNLYIASGFSLILKVTSAGVVTIFSGRATGVQYVDPRGVAIDNSGAETIYVADTWNHTIRKISSGTVTTLAGLEGVKGNADGTGSAARFYAPQALCVDSSFNVFVTDTENRAIRKITPSGVVTTL